MSVYFPLVKLPIPKQETFQIENMSSGKSTILDIVEISQTDLSTTGGGTSEFQLKQEVRYTVTIIITLVSNCNNIHYI